MATRYHSNTDHWSKMRMNVIKNTINTKQRGRVLSWEKHQQVSAQRELDAAVRGTRNLPEHRVGAVHNFQDILTNELKEFLPGMAYFHRHAERNLRKKDASKKEIVEYGHPLLTGSQYTLMTLPTDSQNDQTKNRVPTFQCPGKI